MSDGLDDQAEPEKRIFLPAPEGYRLSKFLFRNGLQQSVDMSPEELDAAVDACLADPEQKKLTLRDPDFGEMFVVRRNALEEELLAIFVMYHKNPAPQEGKRGDVVVARVMPNDAQEKARRLRRLN